MLPEKPSASSSNGDPVGESGKDKDYIEHRVSNLDTVAGVAIKYGVEVADIKRVNGLGSDLHMFGHQTLKIPLLKWPMKHVATSASQVQEHSRSPICDPKFLTGRPSEQIQIEKKPVSSAMKLLRGYYGLSPQAQYSSCHAEGMELTSCHAEHEDCYEDEPFSPMTPRPTSKSDKSFVENRKIPATVKSEITTPRLSYEFTAESTIVPGYGRSTVDTGSEPSVRRRAKVEGNSPLTGASEIDSRVDTEDQLQSSYVLPDGIDSLGFKATGNMKALDGAAAAGKKSESISRVFKSMSTSNLQDQAGMQASLSSIKYGSKVDTKSVNQVQSLSKSILEGLSKPALPRYKEALD